MRDHPALADDAILPFKIGDTAVRGRVVRLGPAIDAILAAHRFPDAVSELVGEATALVALMGSSLKFDGRLILQAQGDGPAPMLVADYSADGALRATASLKRVGAERGLAALVGEGHLALTIDQGPDMERYQGVTPIEGASLAEAAIAYFDRSEQIPTVLRLAVGRVTHQGGASAWRAGGVIVQLLPGEGGFKPRAATALKGEDERETFDRAATLLATAGADELLDPSLAAERLLYRLYHEDGVRVFAPKAVRAQCRCNSGKIAAVLTRYGEAELSDMVEDGAILVSCEFCRAQYRFDASGRAIA